MPGTVLVSGWEVFAFVSALPGEHRLNEGGHLFSVFITVFKDSLFSDIIRCMKDTPISK